MMFGDVFRVIGNKVEENSFLAKTMNKPLGNWVKILNFLKLSV